MRARAASGFALVLLGALTACSSEEADPREGEDANEVVGDKGQKAPEKGAAPDAYGTAPQREVVVHSLANIGDSISQGFDADDSEPIDLGAMADNPSSIFHDNPQLSWVQGTDPRVGSVAAHYKALDPGLVMTPLSRSGAELVGLGSSLPNFAKQAQSIATTAAAGGGPDLVFVLLGGNDVCNRAPSTTADATANMYSVDQWKTAVKAGLAALEASMKPGSTVRFVSMPRADLLFDALGSSQIRVKFPSPVGPVTGTSTCKNLWSLAASQGAGICKIVTTETNADRRKAIGERIDAYNQALAEEVRRFEQDVAANPKKIHFESDWQGSLASGAPPNTSGGTFIYEPRHVSKLDCFHPSIIGQKEIANLVLTRADWRARQ